MMEGLGKDAETRTAPLDRYQINRNSCEATLQVCGLKSPTQQVVGTS